MAPEVIQGQVRGHRVGTLARGAAFATTPHRRTCRGNAEQRSLRRSFRCTGGRLTYGAQAACCWRCCRAVRRGAPSSQAPQISSPSCFTSRRARKARPSQRAHTRMRSACSALRCARRSSCRDSDLSVNFSLCVSALGVFTPACAWSLRHWGRDI
eukprot:5062004-Prymnesium_polylepis.4